MYRHRPDGSLRTLLMMLVLGVAVSGVLQVVTDIVPATVSSTTPVWFDDFYTWLQLVAAVILLIALQRRLPDVPALILEGAGGLMLAGALGAYFAATFDAVTVPKSAGVWMCGMLALWYLPRTVHHMRVLRDARRTSRGVR